MSWLDKIFSKEKKKGIGAASGFDILRRMIAPELSKTGMLETYGKSLYVFACISKIAEKTASIPLELYRVINSKGDTKEIQTHPSLDLFYKPNKFQTKSEFWETMIINLKTTGDAFIWKIRNKSGKVAELWNLRPDWMTIITDPVNFIKEYQFQKSDGTMETFAPEEIIHLKYPDPLSAYMGMSPLKSAQVRVQTEEFASRYQRDFFLNNARPDAVIKNQKQNLTAEQKIDIREGWNKRHQGVGNSSKVAILEGGLDYQQISLTQRDMDYIEGMKFTRDDILVAFKVPKPIVAITDDVNRANAETAMYIFLSETIVPEMRRITEKFNEELVIPDFGDDLYIDFTDPTPQNREMVMKEYDTGIKDNYLLINEVRQKEGLPPVKGGWSFYMPLMNQAFGGLSSADQQKAIERMMGNSDDNEKIISGLKKKKIFNFSGRYWLKQKLMMREDMARTIIQIVKMKKKIKSVNSDKAKSIKKPVIEDAEKKKLYAEMVNKKIDAKTLKLKEGTTKFAMGQKERVMGKIDGIKKEIKEKIKIESIFDKKEEDRIAAEFIIPYIEEFLKESGMDALSMLAPQETFSSTQAIQKKIKKRAEEFAESVNSTTLEGLETTLAEGVSAGEGIRELADRVESVYENFPVYRSELIARTEATAANNEGLLEGFRQSDVATGKEWINAGDDRVRPEHQDGVGVGGEIVKIDENFSNGLPYPQEPNCRCVIAPAFVE